MKCNILSTFALKNYRKFTDHNLEKLCRRSLALASDFFFESLALASNVVSSTPPLFICRGGVEDTRLEAKAKDTQKIRGQGQPFRGQTLSRPRTGMLEAKAKDEGHKRKCSPKKKGLHKNFSGDLQKKKKKVFTKMFQVISTKKRFPKNFSSASQNFNNSKNTAVLKPIFEDRPIFEDLRPRGQGQGLDLRGQGQGLQNVSSRTPPLFICSMPIRTISMTFFFTVHSLYKYVQSNQSNTLDCKKPTQQEQIFFFNALPFYSARLFLVY